MTTAWILTLVGRRAEIRIGDREVTAVVLDSRQPACHHTRSFAKHRTITGLERVRTLKRRRDGDRAEDQPAVEARSLAVYDQLMA